MPRNRVAEWRGGMEGKEERTGSSELVDTNYYIQNRQRARLSYKAQGTIFNILL